MENPKINSNEFELNWKKFNISENTFNEWKTKILYDVLNSDWTVNDEYIVIEEKDIVTAGDWARTETVEWKGEFTSNINSNYFEYLNDLWMKTAFVKKLDNNRTLVKKLDMIPIECVYRFVSTGSHQRREKYKAKNIKNYKPKEEGEILDEMIIDLYFKDDVITKDWLVISDPLIKLNDDGIPEIDSDWKLILLNPDTEEILDYDNIVKKSLPEIKDSEWKIVKHFKFLFENWEFLEEKFNVGDDSLIKDYIKVYNADNWEDITEIAKITSDMISVEKIDNENKNAFKDIQDNSGYLIEETKKFGKWVQQLNDKVGLSTLDWKWEFWKDKKWKILFWDSLDADSNRIRKVFTVVWEDWNTYLARDYFTKELSESWKDSSYFEKLEVIPKNIKVKKIWIAAWLDKEWFRKWESGEELLKKIEKLSTYTTKAKDIHNEEVWRALNRFCIKVEDMLKKENIINMTQCLNNDALLDILWRKITKKNNNLNTWYNGSPADSF